jgi:hypothetical protein
MYGQPTSIYIRPSSLEIVGYSDADWAGCVDTLKSTPGYVFTLDRGAVFWKSCKQTVVASSTMHIEFVAMHEARTDDGGKEICTRIKSG